MRKKHYSKLGGKGAEIDLEEQAAWRSRAPELALPSQLELERAAEEAFATSSATTSDAPDVIDDSLVLNLEQISLEDATDQVGTNPGPSLAATPALAAAGGGTCITPLRNPPCHAGRGRAH